MLIVCTRLFFSPSSSKWPRDKANTVPTVYYGVDLYLLFVCDVSGGFREGSLRVSTESPFSGSTANL